MTPLLEMRDLAVSFAAEGGRVSAVDGASLSLAPGEALGLVGESGSGKSVTALAIMGLLPRATARVDRGTVRLRGRDLLSAAPDELRAVRGRQLAMVHQDPMTSLNPALTVGQQIAQVVRAHDGGGRRAARERAAELLHLVGIPDPRQRLDDHPHRFSGGQRQRVLLAAALSCEPAVLIADEPTTALDVTVQAQIVALVRELRERLDMAILWITHDLGVVAGLVDRVAVMYAGRVVEEGPVRALYARPAHPYTAGLLRSLPAFAPRRRARLLAIPGAPPAQATGDDACPFAPRCPAVVDACRRERPAARAVGPGHVAACLRAGETTRGAA